MRAPFPYFGGKSRVANIVWQRLGNVENYVEPFIGSAAVLLRRPREHFEVGTIRIETVNDVDAMIANFWRAIALEPELTASYADWPVNENDLHARHKWLVDQKESLREKLESDPEWCDAKIAGWWVWGMCLWIGGGFCKDSQQWKQRPVLSNNGQGIHKMRMARGTGIKREGHNRRLPRVDRAIGTGVNRMGKLKRELPRLARGTGINARHLHLGRSYQLQSGPYDVYQDFDMLSARLRRVRVVCGDWKRVTSPTATHYHNGTTGVFLDPPYLHDERDPDLYANDEDVFEEVWKWSMENGENPKMRIAVCGLDDGRTPAPGWTTHRWKANGGYGRLGKGKGQENARREMIWFSPHCLNLDQSQLFKD